MPDIPFITFSDLHCPNVDWSAFNKVVHAIDEVKPKLIVLNGDLVEADYTSKHNPDERHKFGPDGEMDACAKVMKAINEAAPDAHKV
ncbi:MAG: hypothetical protein ACK4NQ_03660, partial [Fimbriimonadaceae bacterium]